MSMDTKERHMLKRLQKLLNAIPKQAPDADWVVAMNANAHVLKNVLNAQEPAHKTAACFAAADKQLDDLDHFVTRRQTQNWKSAQLSRN